MKCRGENDNCHGPVRLWEYNTPDEIVGDRPRTELDHSEFYACDFHGELLGATLIKGVK